MVFIIEKGLHRAGWLRNTRGRLHLFLRYMQHRVWVVVGEQFFQLLQRKLFKD